MADPAWNVINESATGFHIFRIEVMYIKYKELTMPDQGLRQQMISGVDCLRNFQWEENYTLISKQIANESRKKALAFERATGAKMAIGENL